MFYFINESLWTSPKQNYEVGENTSDVKILRQNSDFFEIIFNENINIFLNYLEFPSDLKLADVSYDAM